MAVPLTHRPATGNSNAAVNVVSVVGARPQFIKLAPVCRAISEQCPAWRHRIIHTGQHYDRDMSAVFFEQLHIPKPDVDLGIGSGPHGAQTGSMLAALETEFERSGPDVVMVYGDTNSTLAGTLAASKMHIAVCHIEAGLRSFNREMPEEINRLVADHCADRLYVPTEAGMENLRREGLEQRAVRVGDVMLDAVLYNREIARRHSSVMRDLALEEGGFGVVTLHRPSNTTPDQLRELLDALSTIADEILPLIFPMHPRTRHAVGDASIPAGGRLRVIPPIGYLDMLVLLSNARAVLTDSGGLQKEAAIVQTPCLTLRNETEWIETLRIGANTLVGHDARALRDAVTRLLESETHDWSAALASAYGDGDAATRIVKDLQAWIASRNSGSNPG